MPDRFKGKDIIDVCPPFLRLTSLQMAVLIEDDDAATGFAWALTSETPENTADHTPLPEFGISDVTTKFLDRQELSRQEIPEDEGYHWYKAGTFKASPTTAFYAHHSWRLSQRLYMAYNGSLPEQPTFTAYVSLKLQGPDYVSGSTKQTQFAIDRILLVKEPKANQD